ncbi:hypothetical protein [Janthinobacterium violaceinigrum]|uniref:Uncharacterized protein n=1 Tax=Janthinobacterium violaceinigrum TaxID=2654252 RepID=A0A6I1IDA3_9BURK|nr:hypothetical protein [Janthinobacterium violaceinigrum]KAB8065238.1 hypothetical protein GCN75_09545 [Janthinobacterium violaceinigrum]
MPLLMRWGRREILRSLASLGGTGYKVARTPEYAWKWRLAAAFFFAFHAAAHFGGSAIALALNFL